MKQKLSAEERMLIAADASDASEHAIQAAFFVSLRHLKDPRVPFIFACPNGGDRNISVAAMMVKEGVKKGVPDVIMPFYAGRHPFGVIEFKRLIHRSESDGGLKPDQIRYRDHCLSQNAFYRICYTWEEGLTAVIDYIEQRKE